MWCKQCRQDVPALPSADKQNYCCPRCGETISVEPSYDGWEMDEQLRHCRAGSAMQQSARTGEAESIYRREASRFDLPHAGPPTWHAPAARPPAKQRKADQAGSPTLAGRVRLAGHVAGHHQFRVRRDSAGLVAGRANGRSFGPSACR